MRRADVLTTSGDDPLDEELTCGIVQVGGQLVCCEGDSGVAASVLTSRMTTPGYSDGVTGAENPDEFFLWAPMLLSGIAQRVTEEYQDDDSLYDLPSGLYVGDDANPPIADE